MTEPQQPPVGETKKLLENPIVGSLVVPIAIVLVGALIIFGVTKMLSTDRSYKDLVHELHSKTFGNRWIAAYELSKQISAKKIPDNEVPWLITNLSEIYDQAVDPRTRDFIVVALGSLKTELALPIIQKALNDKDPKVQFSGVVAIGNMPSTFPIEWTPLLQKMRETKDEGLRQAIILGAASHRVKDAQVDMVGYLDSTNPSIRYAAALGLINFKDEKALPVLEEILFLVPPTTKPEPGQFGANETVGLQLNILNALQKNEWKLLNGALSKLIATSGNKLLVVKAQEALNLLKN